jgi:hypothetical protein
MTHWTYNVTDTVVFSLRIFQTTPLQAALLKKVYDIKYMSYQKERNTERK